MTAPSAATLKDACEALAAGDPALKQAHTKIGLPTWRARAANYQTLAQIVVYQLISTKAADAIWARVLERHSTVTAPLILGDDQDDLLACGLSRPKLAHLNAIATAVETKVVVFEDLASQPIEVARKTLLSVRGIGPWTADTFLMNALGRLDAFPHGDVALIEAYRQLNGDDERLSSKAFSAVAETWRPYRAVAAHLLYDWLHSVRD